MSVPSSVEYRDIAKTSVLPSAACDFARSFLSKTSDDYIFCSTGNNEYLLLICDHIVGDRTSFYCYREDGVFTFVTFTFALDGGSGDPVFSAPSYAIYTDSQYEALLINDNPNNTMYSTLSDCPDLRTGGEHYAFFISCCLVAFALFVLMDRILRHIR